MQRRLLNFFTATRAQSDRVEWSFDLHTTDNLVWTESRLATIGMPSTWVIFIHVTANYPFAGRLSRGCFTTYRIIRPRRAAWHILCDSESLVADVLAEFSKRLPEIT